MASVSRPEDVDQRTTRGLIGFYASCTVFGIAVTIMAVTWVAFPDLDGSTALGWAGLVFALLSAAATWHFLGVMRRER